MFTGIIEEIGAVRSIEVHDGHARLWVACSTVLSDVGMGDSIAVNGCCLTVDDVDRADGVPVAWAADLMAETLRATSLGDLAVDSPVNLERAMAATTRFGGHIVQGHVDGVGTVLARDEQPGTVFFTFRAPADVSRYVVPKGSITVDGTSLTVVDVTEDPAGGARFRVGMIPHTLEATVFGNRQVGDRVNLEADVIAKYVERMLAGGTASPYAPAGGTTDQPTAAEDS